MAELEELEQQGLEESMESMGGLPSVPNSKLPSAHPSHRACKCGPSRTSTLIYLLSNNLMAFTVIFFLFVPAARRRVEEEEDDMNKLASWAT